MSGMRGTPRDGRSLIQYCAESETSNKKFIGNKFVSNSDFSNRTKIEYQILSKHASRGMQVRILDMTVKKDTYFL